MSRVHVIAATIRDIADHFGIDPVPEIEWADEVVEGNRGLIVRESRGRRVLQVMKWGFPRQSREERERDEPIGRIGLMADLTNPMWERLVVDPRYRCLIGLSHFANPDGHQGEQTRTWFSMADQPIMAWAGFCRNTPEFGPVYAGMTMEANEAIPPTKDRMPVILAPAEYDSWLHGSLEDVIRFQFRPPIAADRLVVERTDDLWRSGDLPPSAQPQGGLF
jgi:putative SOS response-associated peptidase YedK